MSEARTWATAGLVFEEYRDLDIVQIANHVGNSIETLGHRIEGVHIRSDTSAQVAIAGHEISLAVEEEVALVARPRPATVYLSISISSTGPGGAFARDSTLARILRDLYQELEPDFVKWTDTGVVLAGDDFASAAGLAPKPGTRRLSGEILPGTPLPDVETTNDILQKRLTGHGRAAFEVQRSPARLRRILTENPDADEAMARDREDIETSPPLRLAAWFMTFAVALFSLPVGAMLIVLNLTKGENLRLASQAAALTGTYISLQTYGVTASAMAALQSWFG